MIQHGAAPSESRLIYVSLFTAEDGEGAGAAAFGIVGGGKGEIGIEDVGDGLLEALEETVSVDGNVCDRFTADDERGVVALSAGMLDEK